MSVARSAVVLGLWCSLAAIWPVWFVRFGRFYEVLWQPALFATLGYLSWTWRREGWSTAIGRALWCYAVFTVAGWLPWLRTTHWEKDYPKFYELYLLAYECGIAALLGYQALRVMRGGSLWAKPLAIAPLLLIARGLQTGNWETTVAGAAAGALVAAARPGRWAAGRVKHPQRWLAVGIFVFAFIVAYGGGMRIYQQLGERFPFASDDGPSYYTQAVKMAEAPARFFTGELEDELFFTGYYPLMGLWFNVAGPHMPSWLLWHGMAGGVLALAVFWIGRRLAGPVVGAVAAWLTACDHVMLHLMSTMNMETFFIPALYVGVWLWCAAAGPVAARPRRLCFLAGLMLGVATFFRPTSVLFPVALMAAMFVERPRASWLRHTAWMVAGFLIPIGLLYIRNRMAWGAWTLASNKAQIAMTENYALTVQGQNLGDIGLGPWLNLIAQQPQVIWQHILPKWWEQVLYLWTHPGFGQMDLVRGLTHEGPYQAALASVFALTTIGGAWACVRRRSRPDVMMLALPLYFTALVLVFFVLNSRYRSPFLPALYLLSCLGCSLAVAGRTPPVASKPDVQAAPKVVKTPGRRLVPA